MQNRRFTLDERIDYYERKLEGNFAFERLMKLYAQRGDAAFQKAVKRPDAATKRALKALKGAG